MRKKGITKTGRKQKRAMKRERTRERACVFYKPSFLSSLLFSSLRCFAFWKNFHQTQEGEKRTKQPPQQQQQRLSYSSPRLSRKLVEEKKKNRQTTAATNKRSAPEDMQSARFRHHRQREKREEKRKERAPRSASRTRSLRGTLVDHYAHGWWRVPSLRATQIPSLRVAGIPSLRPQRSSVKSFSRKAGEGRVPSLCAELFRFCAVTSDPQRTGPFRSPPHRNQRTSGSIYIYLSLSLSLSPGRDAPRRTGRSG